MTKTESTIRFLFGASRKDIRPLVHAVDITMQSQYTATVAWSKYGRRNRLALLLDHELQGGSPL
ncbi:MAG: hypothetical protein ACLR1T_04700 [Evtepia gabavorous]